MKTAIIILLALTASAQASWFNNDEKITVRFGITNSFFEVPMTINDAVKENWIKATQHDNVPKIYKDLAIYCFGCDGSICVLYDQHSGYVAGIQVGFDIENIYDNAYDLEKNGWNKWTWTCDGVSRTFYVIRVYFVTAEYLSKSAAERKVSHDKTKILQNGYVVTEGPRGELKYFSSDCSIMRSETSMTKQACVPAMGVHYYYNMTETLECSAETIYPWFVLTDNDKVIGCAMMTFLKIKEQAGSRDWFEHPAQAAVKFIVPHGPQCFYDYANSPGAVTMHINFKPNPRLTGCPLF